ncbi:MAG: FAD-dependent oxidoreductase, partial [Tenericutes bacterium]|nr:FAD-dependent oxidoreductase [Mycoplasmatota bacterium]
MIIMLLINQLKVKLKLYESLDNLKGNIAKILTVGEDRILDYTILRKSIDARKKDDILFVFNVLVKVKGEKSILSKKISNVSKYIFKNNKMNLLKNNYSKDKKIAIVGFGPAGIFSALTFAQAGVKVTVFERGEEVDKRIQTIKKFETEKILNTESNIQFGEGGAGTYSDGKLTNRKKDPLGKWLFDELVKAGAPEEILYDSSPHIGSDKLINVVKNIRNEIINLGSTINFNSRVSNIVPYNDGLHLTVNGVTEYFDYCILAIGHSSRDTIEMLFNNNCHIAQKPFAVGFRIEHLQKMINKAQFGFEETHHLLGPAEYKLTHRANEGRGVYTFCMCPGGMVVPSTSEEGMVVTNGMSEYKRDKINANSALLVTVNGKDFGSEHPLAGIEFQRRLERKAFLLGGSNYNAPIQRVGDFIINQTTKALGSVLPSYPIGVTYANMRSIFTPEINQVFIEAMTRMGNELSGFDHEDALLTGVESRSSSPVRITRDNDTLQSISTK